MYTPGTRYSIPDNTGTEIYIFLNTCAYTGTVNLKRVDISP
jgi:hypothetical protein